ncbi:MAG: glycosyltransferase family 39 protein, partial [Candidatus Omnitrophica bacterium]|nr:glycosyltransferase family 39 protein [Candidatus Omnitrophota bacterium]
MNKNKLILIVLTAAITIKIALFAIAVICAPESKFENDSRDYLQTAETLYSRGAFAQQNNDGTLRYEMLRTPGYPVFLGALHNLLKIPLHGVILVQVFLTLLIALFVYYTAARIDIKIAFLSAVIILFDLPSSVFSLMIMTETLFTFFMALFMLSFILYLKEGAFKWVMASAITLVISTYIRPISYYIGIMIAVFILYANCPKNFKKAFIHALLFLVVVYGLIALWQIRNYLCCACSSFSSIAGANFKQYTLIGTYSASTDAHSAGFPPILYYIDVTLRCSMSFMTRPGNLKYFGIEPLTIFAKVLAYPWMAFWVVGFIAGMFKIGRNIYYQFLFLIILYFV